MRGSDTGVHQTSRQWGPPPEDGGTVPEAASDRLTASDVRARSSSEKIDRAMPMPDHYPPETRAELGGVPTEAKARKAVPVGTGVVDYFPLALVEIARVSFQGNQQHNPGTHLHWDRAKSTDEADALMRHFIDRGTFDVDGLRHSAKMAWRALALLQKELEAEAELKGGPVNVTGISERPHR